MKQADAKRWTEALGLPTEANCNRDLRRACAAAVPKCRPASPSEINAARSGSPIPVVVLDCSHHVVAANASFLDLMDRSCCEIRGEAISNLIWPVEGGAELYHLVDEVLKSGIWFHDHVIPGLDSTRPLGPLAIGGHRIFASKLPEPLVLLTIQPCENACW